MSAYSSVGSSPLIRDNLNRALVFSDGDFTTFVTHPLSAMLLTIALVALLMTARHQVRRRPAAFGWR
jgi:putative tricarboxylic transport membrane protein